MWYISILGWGSRGCFAVCIVWGAMCKVWYIEPVLCAGVHQLVLWRAGPEGRTGRIGPGTHSPRLEDLAQSQGRGVYFTLLVSCNRDLYYNAYKWHSYTHAHSPTVFHTQYINGGCKNIPVVYTFPLNQSSVERTLSWHIFTVRVCVCVCVRCGRRCCGNCRSCCLQRRLATPWTQTLSTSTRPRPSSRFSSPARSAAGNSN